MLELPSDIRTEDVTQWLGGGWFFVLDSKGGKQVASLEDVDDDRLEVYTTERDAMRVPYSAVRAHWPQCGAINLVEFAVNVVREQRRQWRRTYNSRQVRLNIPRKWDLLKMHGAVVNHLTPDSPIIVESLFNPVYPTYEQAMADLRDGTAFSRALNPYIIVAGTEQTTLLYYRGALAAKIRQDKLQPIGADASTLRRLLKYFDGRVTL